MALVRCDTVRLTDRCVTKIAKQFGGGKYVPCTRRVAQEKDFELILMVKYGN